MKKILYIFFLILINSSAFSHIEHYKNIKEINFDIYRNNKLIGYHNYDFIRENDELIVKSKIFFEIKKLGVVLYKYRAEGIETYRNNKFISFSSSTKQNKKDKFCKIFMNDNKYFIEGSSYKGEAPEDFIIGTWWNHSIVNKKSQISAISGRIIKQNVSFLGKEKINIGGKDINTLHFNFSSSDKKLSKDKKLNTDVWYEENTLNWVKASFNKQGYWEYRLKDIKFYK